MPISNLSLVPHDNDEFSGRAMEILSGMSLAEKIGQMTQVNGGREDLHQMVREGRVGSVLNEVNVNELNELQRIAAQESRLGIPLLIGRDVIHGFKTIFPIPLGQAASWSPELVEQGAAIAATEAASSGVNWTFAPMIDITRDPRWGRIAESFGEDSFLCSSLGAAAVRGFQGERLNERGSIAACAKHFAGYGATEGGLDYNTANIPENELRNVYLRPFKAALDAGVATFMASFSDLNGVPATGNEFLMNQVLREEWQFEGFVVSDWDSIRELITHGYSATEEDAALDAVSAGINMEMASDLYTRHLEHLVGQGKVSEDQIDRLTLSIIRTKLQLGLFEDPYTNPSMFPQLVNDDHLCAAREAAQNSCVLLKNHNQLLPLSPDSLDSLAVIGPLADDGYEQLGTWVFDGESQHSHTCLQAMHALIGDDVHINWAPGMSNPRSRDRSGCEEAVNAALASDAVVMVMGEDSILSGEAHCRADISLPGDQEQLIEEISKTGKPIVLVVMAGRPLTLDRIIGKVDAVLYAWHPGTMGGPAIADLLFGIASPSGKLPVTFPLKVGQVPIYYSRKNTGRPPSAHTISHIDHIDGKAGQTSLGMSAFHLDAGFKPLFPFGFGLSYVHFEYSDISVSADQVGMNDAVEISATVCNTGDREATEVVQLYVRDLVGSVTRPIRELKGFRRIKLHAGQSTAVQFVLHAEDLSFYGRDMELNVEPGKFHAWIGGSSEAELWTEFELIKNND